MKLSPVIASQRVGAKRRPMTGSAKQSMYPRVLARMDCLVAEFIIGPAEGGTRWLLAMTEGAAGSVIAYPTTRHPEVAASSAALEGRRPGSVILRSSQELAPPGMPALRSRGDDDFDARVRAWPTTFTQAA